MEWKRFNKRYIKTVPILHFNAWCNVHLQSSYLMKKVIGAILLSSLSGCVAYPATAYPEYQVPTYPAYVSPSPVVVTPWPRPYYNGYRPYGYRQVPCCYR